MNEFRSYISEIKSKPSIIALLSLILMTIYIYQGSVAYFYKNILPLFSISQRDLWTDFIARTYQCFSVFFLFFLIPLLSIKFFFKESAKHYGFRVGDFLFGFKFLLIALFVISPFIFLSSFQNDFQQEYPLPFLAQKEVRFLILWEFIYIFYYIGWEFLFRGFLLFSLKEKIGAFWAIIFQTFPSTIIHIGKPQGETFSAIIAGIVFGALALRTRSIFYPLLLHYLIAIMMDVFCFLNR